ncbi:hypothetical protein D9Q98_009884 [Chlorella vulgaris]|uniref:Endonuclease V n=1 Tax=Chlorella vulgaris TaxID=3077 RepID=A0A9D4YT25_CHLVU|nr:hypothetical protein D9Q98_009884 [Chlorella vulgaris]
MALAVVLEEWEREQAALRSRVIRHNDAEWLAGGPDCATDDPFSQLQLVAGLDISFFPSAANDAAAASTDNASCITSDGLGASPLPGTTVAEEPTPAAGAAAGDRAVAALAVLSFPDLQLRHLELLELQLSVPYLPGLLAYREVPAYLELLQRAAAAGVHPQLLMVDGFGVLHPRRCGSASHLGVLAGLPTVGVAKSLLHVEGLLPERKVRAAVAAAAAAPAAPATASEAASEKTQDKRPCSSPPGDTCLPLVAGDGEVLGAAVCGAASSGRPIYVSVGHRISLASAVSVVRRCCHHRVPEPIRQADLLSRAEVRRLLQPSNAGSATALCQAVDEL